VALGCQGAARMSGTEEIEPGDDQEEVLRKLSLQNPGTRQTPRPFYGWLERILHLAVGPTEGRPWFSPVIDTRRWNWNCFWAGSLAILAMNNVHDHQYGWAAACFVCGIWYARDALKPKP
jgi:hypothetical protein